MIPQRVNFPWITPKNAVVEVVGIPPLIFENPQDYNERQAWLPFVSAIIAYTKQPVEKKKKPKTDDQKKPTEREYALIPEGSQYLFSAEKDVPQLPLPFEGWRRVRNSYWRRLSTAKFPGWEKHSNGETLKIIFNADLKDQVIEFCELNCLGRYFVKPGKLYLELKIDYVKAHIAFGIGN